MVFAEYKNAIRVFTSSDESHRKRVIDDATQEAHIQVKTDYPYAVYRSQPEVTQHAQQVYQQWLTIVEKTLPEPNRYGYITPDERATVQKWKNLLGETKRLYISAFVAEYLEQVVKKDKEKEERERKAKEERERKEKEEKERKERTVQPATPTGATITVIREDHNTPNVHKYWVRIADPIHFGEAQDFPLPLVVDFSEAPATD